MITEVREAGQRGVFLASGSAADRLLVQHHVRTTPPDGLIDVVPAARGTLLEFRRRADAVTAAAELRRLRRRRPQIQPGTERIIEVVYDDDALGRASARTGLGREALIEWHSGRLWMAAFLVPPAEPSTPWPLACAPAELTQRNRLHRTHGQFLDIPAAGPNDAGPHDAAPTDAGPSDAAPAEAVSGAGLSVRDGTGVVGLYGAFSAVFAAGSLSGWQVLGRTSQVPGAAAAAHDRAAPGDLLGFRAVREVIAVQHGASTPAPRGDEAADAPSDAAPATIPAGLPSGEVPAPDVVFDVVQPGSGTTFQDAGRPGCAQWAVPRGGEADAPAARQANQLVGNDDAATTLEIDSTGLRVRARQTAVIAVTGAILPVHIETPAAPETSNMARSGTTAAAAEDSPDAEPTRRPVTQRAPCWIYRGEELVLGPPERGRFAYLAVSGGLSGVERMGSTSSSARLARGDRLALAGASSRFVGIASVEPTRLPVRPDPTSQAGETVVRYVPGPQSPPPADPADDGGSAPASHGHDVPLRPGRWRAATAAGRDHVLLEPADPGPGDVQGGDVRPGDARAGDVQSGDVSGGDPPDPTGGGYPVPRGALLAAAGGLRLALPDHPVISPRPVLGVVVREDRGLSAQLVRGDPVRLVPVDPETLAPLESR